MDSVNFKKHLNAFFLFIFCFLLLGATPHQCLKSVEEVFKNPHNQKIVDEFMRLQGNLTLHKLAYALFQNDLSTNRLKVEYKIRQLIDQLDLKTKKSAKFKSVRDEFYSNPLSRTALSKILPYLKNIINSQFNIEDPYDHKYFILNHADIKLLAIVADGEEKLENTDLYDHRLFLNRNKIQSVLNFTKLINSSLSSEKFKQKINPDSIKAVWENKISDLNKWIDHFISIFPISNECKQLISSACIIKEDYKNYDLSAFKNEFLNIISDFLSFDKQRKLRIKDFWLDITKNNNLPPLPQKNQFQHDKNSDNNFVAADEGTPILEYLKRKILDHYPYFVTPKVLDQNPDLIFSLSQAIDTKNTKFTFKGKQFFLPSLYNRDNYIELERHDFFNNHTTYSFLFKERFPEIETEDMMPSTHCISSKREVLNLAKAMKGLRIYNDKNGTDLKTFHYNNKICDGKTGKTIPNSLTGLLSYPALDNVSNNYKYSEYLKHSKTRKEIIDEAIHKKSNYYIFKGKVFHISGLPVRNKFSSISSPKVLVAKLDGKKNVTTFSNNGMELIDTRTGKPITLSVTRSTIKKFLISTTPGNLDTSIIEDMTPDFLKLWHEAIDAKKLSFQFDGMNFSTLNGLSFKSKGTIKIDGKEFIEDTYLYQAVDNINALDDDKHTLIEYHKLFKKVNSCDYYTIIDKKEGKLEVFSNEGELLFNEEVLLGRKAGDERTRFIKYETGSIETETNFKTGAGIYFSKNFKRNDSNPYYSENFDGNLLSLKSQYRDESVLAIHQVPEGLASRLLRFANQTLADNRSSGGCINMTPKAFQNYFKNFNGKNCPIYVLPEDKSNRFIIRGEEMAFTPRDRAKCDKKAKNSCDNNFNYTPPSQKTKKEIRITYNEKEILKKVGKIDSDKYKKAANILRSFVSSLEVNQKVLMEKLSLSNAEYNALAKVAIGVLGIESKFGISKKYDIKENLPKDLGQYLVHFLKKLSYNKTAPSRGLTQIKNINLYMSAYGFAKIDEQQLNNPAIAAKSTMIILADMLKTLRVEEKRGAEFLDFSSRSSQEESIKKYLYYLYQGRRGQIKNSLATPTLNTQSREIQRITGNVITFHEF